MLTNKKTTTTAAAAAVAGAGAGLLQVRPGPAWVF